MEKNRLQKSLCNNFRNLKFENEKEAYIYQLKSVNIISVTLQKTKINGNS